jgi:hypothetical protein
MTRSGKEALARRTPARRHKPNAPLRLMEPRRRLSKVPRVASPFLEELLFWRILCHKGTIHPGSLF